MIHNHFSATTRRMNCVVLNWVKMNDVYWWILNNENKFKYIKKVRLYYTKYWLETLKTIVKYMCILVQ